MVAALHCQQKLRTGLELRGGEFLQGSGGNRFGLSGVAGHVQKHALLQHAGSFSLCRREHKAALTPQRRVQLAVQMEVVVNSKPR